MLWTRSAPNGVPSPWLLGIPYVCFVRAAWDPQGIFSRVYCLLIFYLFSKKNLEVSPYKGQIIFWKYVLFVIWYWKVFRGCNAFQPSFTQVVVFILSSESIDSLIVNHEVDILEGRADFTWKGHEKLHINEGHIAMKPGTFLNTWMNSNAEWSTKSAKFRIWKSFVG